MNILVLGTGGREHALAWKLAQSPRCFQVFLHPGNAGTKRLSLQTLTAPLSEGPNAAVAEALKKKISLVVVGPEALLAQGYADAFRAAGIPVVGPNRFEAQLETSKIFSKQFMQRAGIPTAESRSFEDRKSLNEFIQSRSTWPLVLKLDGLAAGKGVVIASDSKEALRFSDRIWEEKEFGPGPARVLTEQYLEGREVSYIGLCDGKDFVALASSSDYKRLGKGNTGPNTGGMGSISPSPYFSKDLEEKIQGRIIQKILRQMEKDKMDYRGALYVGLMVSRSGDPFVLEFNARFGDPETQAILPRLQSDLVDILETTAHGSLKTLPPLQWDERVSVYVVGAAAGYPDRPTTADEIVGTETISEKNFLFFSGVREDKGKLLTGGGRVLGVGALEKDLNSARQLAYRGLRQIHWPGMYFREDIGQ